MDETGERSPPRRIGFSSLTFVPRFAYGDRAQLAEVSGEGDGCELGTGFVRLTNASIPWTVKYDEILLVLEGRVTVRTAEGAFEASPNDCIWLPNGTELRYESESALVFYAIHPNAWAKDAG